MFCFILFVTFSGVNPDGPRAGDPDSNNTTTIIIVVLVVLVVIIVIIVVVFVMTRKSKLHLCFMKNILFSNKRNNS